MNETDRGWTKNELDTVSISHRRARDVGSLIVAGVALAGGYVGSLISGNMAPLILGAVLGLIVFFTVQLGMRRVELHNPHDVRFVNNGLRLRIPAVGERDLSLERIHKVWTKHPRFDVVYYFDETGWLRSLSVDKNIGSRIEDEFLGAEAEFGPFQKPRIAFKPVVTIPWLVAGAISLALGLPVFLSAIEPLDRPLWIAGLFGIQGGIAMLVYGFLTVVWFTREQKRRARGEATSLLFAGVE